MTTFRPNGSGSLHLKAANITYRTQYTCRHTYASTMLTKGKDPTWPAKQMGHNDWGMV